MSKNSVSKTSESAQAASQTGALPASADGQNAAQTAAQAAPESPEAPAVPAVPKRYAVAWNSGLHLRCAPGMDQGILAVLADGEAVEAAGEETDGWLPVKTGQGDGWVMARYLRAED